MDGFEIFDTHAWHPFSYFGLNSPLLALQQHTILYTWIALGLITLFALGARVALQSYPDSLFSYAFKKYVALFMNNVEQSCHGLSYQQTGQHTAFIISLFTFLVICNCMVIIPTFEEPTKDLNTTIALALISFFYVQTQAVRAHGIIGYLNEYFKTPLPVFGRHSQLTAWAIIDIAWRIVANSIIALLTFPIELLGKLASVLSLSFRLFGNIFGGSVISSLWLKFKSQSLILQLLGLLSGFNLFVIVGFFGLFEGILQAAVFSMLTLMYLSNALAPAHLPEELLS